MDVIDATGAGRAGRMTGGEFLINSGGTPMNSCGTFFNNTNNKILRDSITNFA